MTTFNPFLRYFFRTDMLRRIKKRFQAFQRKLARSEINDLSNLLITRSPKTIFDVGANVGFFSWQLTRRFPSAKIYAFEPDPKTFTQLRQKYSGHPRVVPVNVALADEVGELVFHQNPVSCQSSLLPTISTVNKSPDALVNVPATTLDKFCHDSGIPRIDLLKIDTEGADLLVLKGARQLLTSQSVDIVMAEALFLPKYANQARIEAIISHLRDHDFHLFNIYVERETNVGQACFGNMLFIHSTVQRQLPSTW